MATLRCERYPQMQIVTQHGRVRFVDGVAEVTEEQAESVLNMPKVYGISLDGSRDAGAESDGAEEEPPATGDKASSEPTGRPPQSAPKDAWVAYANAQDEAVDHSSMTKAELIDKFGG